MKKFEMYVENILLIFFTYLLMVLIVIFSGYFKDSQNFIALRHINPLLVFIGIIVSSPLSSIFPLWNIYEEYRGMKVKKIEKLEHRYKRNYKRLFVGFLFLGILSRSGIIFDFYFCLGFILLSIHLFYILVWNKIKKLAVFKFIQSKIKILRNQPKKEDFYLKLRIEN